MTSRSTSVRAVAGALRGYHRWVSPMRPPACRFTPSCSVYAAEAIDRFGAARGGWLAMRRLLRCHPYHRGGHDPVPASVERDGAGTETAPAMSLPESPGAPRC